MHALHRVEILPDSNFRSSAPTFLEASHFSPRLTCPDFQFLRWSLAATSRLQSLASILVCFHSEARAALPLILSFWAEDIQWFPLHVE